MRRVMLRTLLMFLFALYCSRSLSPRQTHTETVSDGKVTNNCSQTQEPLRRLQGLGNQWPTDRG